MFLFIGHFNTTGQIHTHILISSFTFFQVFIQIVYPDNQTSRLQSVAMAKGN